MFNFLKNISSTELIIIAVIIIFFFGGKMAMKIGKTSGKTLKEIKNIKKSFKEAVEDDTSQKNKKEV